MKCQFFALVVMILSVNPLFADCESGKEWELGRAIQVAPTFTKNKEWPAWKAKLGECVGESVVFSQQCYFYTKPNAEDLVTCFGDQIHEVPWHVVPEKERTFYAFQSDWNAWYKKRLTTINMVNLLLLKKPERQSGPGNLAYTPDKPNPTSKNEHVLTLKHDSWQNMYAVGEMYAQISVREDGAKMKIGQRINAHQVKFFDVRYQIPVNKDWHQGTAPFVLSDMFPGYIFKDGHYPGDDDDIWTARVFVPGYKHRAWTPNNPSPESEKENNIILSEHSWQNMYSVGTTYCQVQKRSNTFKIKFGIIRDGYIEIFNVYRNIPIQQDWSEGDAPDLSMEFPEYKFLAGLNPEGSEVWTAQIQIPGYNL